MKNKTIFLSLLPFLVGVIGCNNTQPSCDFDSTSNSQAEKQVPYEKLFSSEWFLGNGEPTFNASQYQVYIRLDTEDIYYFNGSWILLCKVGDQNDLFGSQLKLIDGKVCVLKRYQVDNEIYYKYMGFHHINNTVLELDSFTYGNDKEYCKISVFCVDLFIL